MSADTRPASAFGVFALTQICILFIGGCPPDIPWFVIPIFIWVSINGMIFCGGASNIFKKGFITIYPFWIHGYSATSPIFKLFCSWVGASLFNVFPGSIFFRACFSRMIRLSVLLSSKTSTAFCISSAKRCPKNNSCISAIANAFPPSMIMLRLILGLRYHYKKSKPLANKLNFLHSMSVTRPS